MVTEMVMKDRIPRFARDVFARTCGIFVINVGLTTTFSAPYPTCVWYTYQVKGRGTQMDGYSNGRIAGVVWFQTISLNIETIVEKKQQIS